MKTTMFLVNAAAEAIVLAAFMGAGMVWLLLATGQI